jgi:hypothetical protein
MDLYRGTYHAGKFCYEVCDECCLAKVLKISIYEPEQGTGRAVLAVARDAHPTARWYTNVQLLGSEQFWQRTSEESGHPYTNRSPSSHLDGAPSHTTPSVSPLHGVVVSVGRKNSGPQSSPAHR